MGSLRPGNGEIGSLYGSETIEVGVCNKRKSVPHDYCVFFNYPYLHFPFEAFSFATYEPIPKVPVSTINCSPKKQKLGSPRSKEGVTQGNVLYPERVRDTTLFRWHKLANPSLDHAQNSIGAPSCQESKNDSCSSDSGYSEVFSNKSSIQSPISSRSSSRSRQQCSTKGSQTVIPDILFESQDPRVGVVLEGNVEQIHLAKHSTDQVLVDGVDMKKVTGATNRDFEDTQRGGDPRTIHQHSTGHRERPHASQQIDPSVANHLSHDEGNSSSSATSSVTSDIQARVATVKIDRSDKLEGLIKDEVFRCDPKVAELVYEKVKGILEYATPSDIEQPVGSHELSLLRLLELEAFGLVQPNGGFTEFAGTSTSGTSAPSDTSNCGQTMGTSSSSANQGNLGGIIPKKDPAPPNEGASPQIKLQKSTPKPIASKARGFRCFHNALYPAIFCVNEETHQKFRTCTGPGWKNMQHLKDHLRDIHMRQVKKPNLLQCSTCLTEFPDQEELANHAATVDCPARCLECDEEFRSKALRLQHQQTRHFEESSEGFLLELDEKKWKKIKDDLKAFNTYSDSLKKGRCEPKPEVENWIDMNIALYQYSRSEKAKAKARIELGQWYMIYTALAPQTKIVDHPFYDNTPILHDEMAEEKILLTNDIIVESKREAHGPPPSDPDLQHEWYREALRDALKIAGRTTRNVTYTHDSPSSTAMNLTLSAQTSSTNPPMGPTPGIDNYGSNMSISASPSVHSGYPEIMPPQPDYLSGAQSQATMNTESDLIGLGMNNQTGWGFNQDGVDHGNDQYHMGPPLFYDDHLQQQFESSSSEMLDATRFPASTDGQGRANNSQAANFRNQFSY